MVRSRLKEKKRVVAEMLGTELLLSSSSGMNEERELRATGGGGPEFVETLKGKLREVGRVARVGGGYGGADVWSYRVQPEGGTKESLLSNMRYVRSLVCQ